MCNSDLLATSSISAPVQQSAPMPKCATPGRRVRLHQMDHWCCSIIGTCLTHEDLLAIARKRKLGLDADSKMFDVHGYFVTQAGRQGTISRMLEKLLDKRYSGMVRRVARVQDIDEMAEFWNEAVSNGQVAGAYWALLSHSHVPDEIRNRVFGEVHMMSHLLGGSTRKIVGAAAELQTKLERIEKQHSRASAQAREALAERDSEIAALKRQLAEARAQAEDASVRATTADPDTERMVRLLDKRERALVAARTKSRELEAELEIANARLAERRSARASVSDEPEDISAPLVKGLCGKAVLYLGGRKGASALLQREAESANVTLHCHDGGLDHSPQLIGDLVEKCDAVICPVNCINHQACLKAKRLCKRLNKPFMPISSSGTGAFSRALGELAGQMTVA